MDKFNFCETCGSKAADEWVGRYDSNTGEKIMRSVCSANRCHTGHDGQRQPLFSRGDWKCSRCGKIGWWPCMHM